MSTKIYPNEAVFYTFDRHIRSAILNFRILSTFCRILSANEGVKLKVRLFSDHTVYARVLDKVDSP